MNVPKCSIKAPKCNKNLILIEIKVLDVINFGSKCNKPLVLHVNVITNPYYTWEPDVIKLLSVIWIGSTGTAEPPPPPPSSPSPSGGPCPRCSKAPKCNMDWVYKDREPPPPPSSPSPSGGHCPRCNKAPKCNIYGLQTAIFVQDVSFIHKLRMEMRQPTVSACPLLWIHWEKLKEIKLNVPKCSIKAPKCNKNLILIEIKVLDVINFGSKCNKPLVLHVNVTTNPYYTWEPDVIKLLNVLWIGSTGTAEPPPPPLQPLPLRRALSQM